MAKVDVSRFIKNADEAANRRNYDLAIFNYIQALSLQPENIDARCKLRAVQTRAATENGSASGLKMLVPMLRAKLQAMLGKHEQAIISCENAITKNPGSTKPMLLLAQCAAKLEMMAVAAWQRQEVADKLDPEDTGNLWELVDIYCDELGDVKQAKACLSKIKEVDPDDDEVDPRMKQLDAQEMTDIFGTAKNSNELVKDEDQRQQLERDPSKLRDDASRMDYINYKKEHDAQERPEDHRVYIDIADVYFNLDDWETGYAEAKKYYDIAHAKNPSDNTVMDKLGDLELKKMRLAMQPLADQYRANAKDPAIRQEYNAARTAILEWETQEYQRRVKAQPLKANFHNRLGELYFQGKRYDDAVGELQQAAKTPEFRIRALTNLGRCFHALEQYDMALEQFERAREGQEVFKKIVEPLYYQALTHEAIGGHENLKKAVKIISDIYQTDISFRDVKLRLPQLQKKIKDLGL